MSEYVNEAIIDDTSTRPHLYDEEVFVSAPAISSIGNYSLPAALSTGFVDQGSIVSPANIKTKFSQRTAYVPPDDPVPFSLPISGQVATGGLRDPDTWYNSDTLIFQPNGTGGGGGSQSLDQVLAIGNSAGTYDIDMNGQQLLSLTQIQSKPGQDFNIINTTDDVNLAGANVNFTAGSAVNVIATTMGLGGSRITNVGTPTISGDATNKLYVDTAITNNIANWSSYPAKTAVDISGRDINNVELITGLTANNNPIVINNSYNLGNTLPQHALIVAGGFDTTGVDVKPVAVAIKKEALYTGTAEEELANLNFYGLDDVGDEELYATIKTFVQDNTKAITDSKMTLGVNVNGVTTTMVEIDGSNNKVKIYNPLDMSSNKIINLGTPTLSTDAATKAYVDASGGASWSAYPATQNVTMANFDLSGVTNIRGSSTAAGKVTFPSGLIDMCGNTATLAMGQNLIYNRVTGTGSFPAGMAFNDPFTAGDANQTAYHFATLTTSITSAIFTMCRKGAFTNLFGVQGTSANNTFVFASQATSTDFEFRRNVGIAPANLTGGTLLGKLDRNGAFSLPLLGTATTANVLYFNTSTGLITYGAAPGGSQNLASVLAVGNKAGTTIDMSQNAITNVPTISNTSATLDITANDLNLTATGLTSVLNIGSTFGTLLSSVGAIDITAGGTTAINSTGNVTIGSLGTTSIENFNLNNSVLTKVPATADLQLNNISQINNNSANIDISSTSVNLNKFQFSSTTLQAQGTNTLFLDDINGINNGAVGGRVDITADIVRANNFEFAGSQMATNGADFELNNIGTLNLTTAGSTIDSKATLQVSGTGLTDAVGFKSSILTSSIGDSIGVYVDQTTATAAGANAVGIYVAGTHVNKNDGLVVGISVQTILGGTGVGDYATGVEVAGSMTGTTKRGFYEHSATAGVVNTFTHAVGVGADPNASYLLDVNGGNARITNTAANPVSLLLENVEGGASANIMRIYKNSSTPAVNDVVGNLQFSGNNASGTLHTYANIQGAILNTTAGAEDGEMRLRTTINSTATDFIHLDGSAAIINMNPNGADIDFNVEDLGGRSLIYADASNSNVMFRNYPQRYIFDICGNYTLTLPNAFNVMRIVAWGAGGGGGSGYKGAASCFGGGAGAGGNGGEVWYDRQELLPDASGSITLYITPGQGGAGGAGVTTAATNGNNGSAGGATYVNLDTFGAAATKQLLTSSLCAGGNGGSGGTTTAGTGGTQASFTGDRNIGSQGRAGASSSITGVPARNTTALLYNGSCYSQTGGSGAGGGVNSAGTTGYDGGIFVSPCGQKYNGLGANVSKAGAVNTGVAGSVVTFDQLTSAAIRPPVGMGSVMAGGGAATNLNQASGAGGGWTYGTPGSRGDGGGGGGGNAAGGTATSGAGGRGADGCVYITIW